MKTYIQPTTQSSEVRLQALICISVDEHGKTTSEQVWESADAPKHLKYLI